MANSISAVYVAICFVHLDGTAGPWRCTDFESAGGPGAPAHFRWLGGPSGAQKNAIASACPAFGRAGALRVVAAALISANCGGVSG